MCNNSIDDSRSFTRAHRCTMPPSRFISVVCSHVGSRVLIVDDRPHDHHRTFSFIIVHDDRARRRCRPGLSWPLSSALSPLSANRLAIFIVIFIVRIDRSVNIIWPLIDRSRIYVCMYRRSISRVTLISLMVAIGGEFAIKYHIELRFDYRTARLMYQHARVSTLWRRLCAVFEWLREGHWMPRTIVACNCFDWFGNLVFVICAGGHGYYAVVVTLIVGRVAKNSKCLVFFVGGQALIVRSWIDRLCSTWGYQFRIV